MPSIGERTLLALIAQIYDAALDAGRWPDFLDSLAEAYGGPAWLFSQDLVNSQASLSTFVRMDPAYAKSYESYFAAKNIWIQNATHNYSATHHFEEGYFAAGQDDIDTATLERTEFYNDWLRPQGLYESAGTCLMKRNFLTTNITVIRGGRPGTFQPEEREAFNRLIPHLQRAVQVHGQLFSASLRRNGAVRALEALTIGMILAAPDGRVVFANPVAERVLLGGHGLGVGSGIVCGATPAATDRLRHAIRKAAATGGGGGDDPGGVIRLAGATGRSLAVLVSPITPEASPFGLPQEPGALLLFADPGRKQGVSPAEMADLYGLSQAEARLLKALADGERLADYARKAGISLNTAKTQLSQVFSKTGENRQSDLIRRVLSDLTVHGPNGGR
ncbi:MAG: helix-turn-helix transcriptional regulator [Rhizobiales bacterium]|nr:helix-turn-helix transcriptional regulator [Hyphomicrobiales bacterium]